VLLGLAFALAACDGEVEERGLAEPIVASSAVFKDGKLPGLPADGQPITEGPAVSADLQGRTQQGASGLRLGGTTNAATHAVGFRLADQGSGYWLAGVGSEDLFVPGQFNWSVTIDFGFNVKPGPHDLLVVGFDKDGKPGKQTKQTICILSDVYDNGNSCNPTVAPPAAVAVLRWNSVADVDLSVLSPESKRYDFNNFFEVKDGKIVAELLGDSSAVCGEDGRQSETFVWHDQPPTGTWYFYANLFEACGHPSVDYQLTLYRRRDNGDGTISLVEERSFEGAFTRGQVNADPTKPLYLTGLAFP
jgi:hypothetical protein